MCVNRGVLVNQSWPGAPTLLKLQFPESNQVVDEVTLKRLCCLRLAWA